MLKILGSIGLGIVLLMAPALLPVPTMSPAGFTMRIDEAKADCNANCMRKCSEATSRGAYMSMEACIAVWSPRNTRQACPVGTCSKGGKPQAHDVNNCSASNCPAGKSKK